MKRPWQIWVLFAICLSVVVPAMAWLTVKACQLDRAEAAARRQADLARLQAELAQQREEAARQRAELEEDVSLALWRMDTWLAPLIAQEAARPYFVYRPFYAVPTPAKSVKGGADGLTEEASPLLIQPSDYVLLNFQVTPEGRITSPQAPAEDLNPLALANGATDANIRISNSRLALLEPQVDHEQLWSRLPEETLPRIELDDFAWNARSNLSDNSAGQAAAVQTVNNLGFAQTDAQNKQAPVVQNEQQSGWPQLEDQLAQSPGEAGQGQAGASQYANPRYAEPQEQQTQMLRGGTEFARRNRAFQNYAQQALTQQRQGIPSVLTTRLVSEGMSQPLWLGPHLVLAHRVSVGDQSLVQGAWLDWDKIKATLLGEIADLLPDADLVPVVGDTELNPARMLAALPVRLVVAAPATESPPGAPATAVTAAVVSPIRVSLGIAWGCLLLAAIAVAILLKGVVSLSERRGAFVAAVTHELRTPLTTFRMYAEMLAEGMVPDAAKRQSYLQTLRVEAERLTHLVSNVLAYARLERSRPGGRREPIRLGDLVDRMRERLADRAAQAEMELLVEIDPAARDWAARTDPGAVEQILFNLVDNACKYARPSADARIHLEIAVERGSALFTIRDHGPGISAKAAKRLFIPFSKSVHDAADSAPGVGLGLALSRRLARDLGGRLECRPANGTGAAFVLTLPVAEREAVSKVTRSVSEERAG